MSRRLRRYRGAFTASGGGEVAPPPAATFTLQPVSWHTRSQGADEGTYGSTRWGNALAIEASGGGTDYYAFETHADADGRYTGVDPGDYLAALAGYTGVEVQHPAGNRTAEQRAVAVAAALDAATPHTVTAVGAEVRVNGAVAGGAVLGMWQPGAAGRFGNRRATNSYPGATISEGVGCFATSAARAQICRAIHVYRDTGGAAMRVAVYFGGSAASRAGTTRVLDLLVPDGPQGFYRAVLTPAQVFAVPASTPFRICIKGEGSVAAPGYTDGAITAGVDFVAQLEVYGTGDVDPDPTVEWPASLASVSTTTPFTSTIMASLELVDADGASAEWRTRWGTRIPDPTVMVQQSSLTIPDAGGADLFMGAAPPNVLGLRLVAHAVGYGTDHGAQLRLFVAQGGEVGDALGADVLWQGRGSGSATQQWVEQATADVSVDATATLWWGCRNDDAAVAFRFSFNADFATASPDFLASDFTGASEFEIFNSSDGAGASPGAHVTDPDVDVASPIVAGTGAIVLNENHPAAYLVLRVPADTVT